MKGIRGFAIRLAAAIAVSVASWFLIVTPFKHIPLSVIAPFVRVIDFPVALAGTIFYPIRAFEVLMPGGGSWCDFCSTGQFFLLQMRIAIPTYLALFYLPAFVRWIARGDRRRARTIAFVGLVYAVSAAAWIAADDESRRLLDVRLAAALMLMLAAATAWEWRSERVTQTE